jgi:hypothetical protein
VSDFFEPLPPLPPEPPVQRQPNWIAPRENEVGVAVPLQFVLARTADLALVVQGGVAYSDGLEFRLALSRRTPPPSFFDPLGRHHGRTGDEVLRFGVEFSDGSKARTLAAGPLRDGAAGPCLTPRGGSGGGRTWHTDFWLWPLPPPGPLVFACEWPAEGLPLTRHEVDASAIIDAAACVETLWPDEGGDMGGGAWTTYGRFVDS